MTTPIESNALDAVLSKIGEHYKTVFEPVAIDGEKLELLQIEDMAALVESLTAGTRNLDLKTFPLWAKLWPASMLTSYALKSLPFAPGRTLLELGAGLGLCGLYAAKLGYKTIISDNNPDSMLFAQANILKNNLQESASVRKLDFTQDQLDQRFDFIIGSEIIYIEDLHRPLIKFLLNHLSREPHAEVMLSLRFRPKTSKFFKLAEKEFHIQQKVIGYKDQNTNGEEERKLCAIYRLKPRKQ